MSRENDTKEFIFDLINEFDSNFSIPEVRKMIITSTKFERVTDLIGLGIFWVLLEMVELQLYNNKSIKIEGVLQAGLDCVLANNRSRCKYIDLSNVRVLSKIHEYLQNMIETFDDYRNVNDKRMLLKRVLYNLIVHIHDFIEHFTKIHKKPINIREFLDNV